ncbi:hypothetical protein H4582DRAFT_2082557 [Lactarius indigo]|nr:hypothetical protein H4582DRAFT_2082557 [Lactarius indigo]
MSPAIQSYAPVAIYAFLSPRLVLIDPDVLPSVRMSQNPRTPSLSLDPYYLIWLHFPPQHYGARYALSRTHPLLADRNTGVARKSGCLIEDKGITFRASYLIDSKGVLRQTTTNDLPV